jgi:hypothetical protein
MIGSDDEETLLYPFLVPGGSVAQKPRCERA